MKRPMGMAVLLASAAGGPYFLYETDAGKFARENAGRLWGTEGTASSAGNGTWDGTMDPASLGISTDGGMGSVFGNANPFPSSQPNYPTPSANSSSYSPSYSPTGIPVSFPGTGASVPPGFPSNANPSGVMNNMLPPSIPGQPMIVGQPMVVGQPPQYGMPITNKHVGPAQPVAGGTPALWNYTTGVPTLPQLQQKNQVQPIVGGPVRDLRDVIRFDITPAWVAQNFGRVSTVLADVQLDGLRVPLVTGTNPSDLAGTITYYFDNQQTLRRINLQGLTGDPSGVANLMQQFYQLKPEKSLGGHLFTTRWNNKVTSMLHVAPAPIMYSTSQNSNFTLFLELNQPSMPYGLSNEAMQILQTGHQTARW